MKLISKKTCLYTLVAAGALTIGTLGFQSSAQAESYKADVYVAGMGGHFAKATVEIDPSAPAPINLKALDKIDIGDNETHPVHDARIDPNNRDLMFWSMSLQPRLLTVPWWTYPLRTGTESLPSTLPEFSLCVNLQSRKWPRPGAVQLLISLPSTVISGYPSGRPTVPPKAPYSSLQK